MISMQGISKSFRLHGQNLPILQIAKWHIQKGERIALMGPSGCGKSTLLHLLSGVITPEQGEIWVTGQPVHLLSESKRDRFRAENIGYIFQDFHLISSLTLRKNVELILPRTWSKRERTEKLDDWFERVGLKDRRDHLPSQLSRGQQQRAAIVRALITKPPLLLADEPTGSLDWETGSELMALLLEICKAEQLTLVSVTHDRHIAEMFPTRVDMRELNELLRSVSV
ncbi:ABC transporter ATP-binding protein [Paenibacillus qinlingensis]|uniref:ABC transport system ATP-binding protein n=1 Tax=Paenibacillus qinlingensis TaxID=1837343 RepID=A0ABU1NUY3_9BACL|nr:ABC transporter ATP-binding protein [Paenibacillus qinlingensis]MDR6551289.1 putative ABC transport system ATP-binding protein [Paenibacillus qinlingensis]